MTQTGRKLLLTNKRSQATEVLLPDADQATALTVDEQTGDGPARSVKVDHGAIHLEPFAVTVVSW